MPTSPLDDAFAKDLGYLERFFDKIEAYAGGLDATAATRLRAFVAEERARWSGARQLVSGSTTSAAPASGKPQAKVDGTERAAAAPLEATPAGPKPGLFTVGSLVKRG